VFTHLVPLDFHIYHYFKQR